MDPDDLTASAVYQPEPEAAAAARKFVRDTLRSWDLPGRSADAARLVDDAVLLTSELVTNALVHAGTPFEVTCGLAGGELEVAISDKHPTRTLRDIPMAESLPAERGRGLLLPSALASCWGVTYGKTAKAVWFRMSLPDDARGGEAGESGTPGVAAAGDAGAAAGVAIEGVTAARTRPGAASPGGGSSLRPLLAAGAGAPGLLSASGAPVLRPDLGTLGYDELLRHTVEAAMDATGADAAYALVADEDGELRVRAAAGIGVSEEDFTPASPTVFADGAPARSLVTVPFLVDGRVTGVLGAAAAAPDRFDSEHAATLQRVADRAALSLERARLSELERARRGRIGFLAEASELLASTLDQEKTISLIAQLVVPRLAAWCAVLLADEGGTLRPAYVWHADESLIDPLACLLGAIDPPEPPGASEAGRSWSLAVPAGQELPEDAASLAGDAAWCFPLAARGRSLGIVMIGRPRGGRLPREALELAEDLARRAALALDNARLYEQQQLTSQALQRSLLPPELPRIPGVDLAVAHEVAGEGNEVGGDFYDVFHAGENRWRFAIGDVCGTGPEAAAVTGLARHTLRILAREGHDVAEVVSRLNQLILEEGPRARFITLLHGEITVLAPRPPAAQAVRPPASGPQPAGEAPQVPARGTRKARGTRAARRGRAGSDRTPTVRLSLVSAGHPLPLLLRAQDAAGGGPRPDGHASAGTAALPQPAAEPQPLLGVIDGLSLSAQSVDLFPGDVLLCVTDGITERRDQGRLLDDDDGLAKLLAGCGGLNAGGVAARIQRAADEFGAGLPSDDMALLVLRALLARGRPPVTR
ncbi:MAG TPA: SpoIIE family protein phosphatase [Streptosporangiaceae bacterium]|nr:SpoIIE family protein phosphatase [Streptosporangiaceae bacterium]